MDKGERSVYVSDVILRTEQCLANKSKIYAILAKGNRMKKRGRNA